MNWEYFFFNGHGEQLRAFIQFTDVFAFTGFCLLGISHKREMDFITYFNDTFATCQSKRPLLLIVQCKHNPFILD